MPHGHCYLWRSDILWLNVMSDAAIALSYYIIPVFLVYLVRKRKDLAFNWMFVMFALFIIACGTTHVLDIWTVWNPSYGAQGAVKAVTAGASVATAFALLPLMPKAIALPSFDQMEAAQSQLRQVNNELQVVNTSLEARVAQKTRDLQAIAAIVGSTTDTVFSRDISGRITSWNSAATHMFGYAADEVIGEFVDELVPTNRRYEMQVILEHLQRGEAVENFETVRCAKDGTEIPVSVTVSPIFDSDGKMVGSSYIARDISKRIAMEARIRDSVRALQLKNQEMEQFVYTVSHDLKSPLVTSSGFLGILKEDLAAGRYENASDSITRLERANSRMNQLIDDLLQLSRIGRIKIEDDKVDVAEMVGGIVENLDSQLRDRGVRISLQSLQQARPIIVADSKRVYQAFDNLIVNAIKYGCSGNEAAIEVGAIDAGDEHHFYVKDNGRGIASEYHAKIFGLFQRLENDNRGTGVGLTIVSRIMQVHGGRVWVESTAGHGATFWLAFPKVFSANEEMQREHSV